MVVALLTALAANARAERVTVGALAIDAPAGFTLDGGRLVANGAVWAFGDPVDTADPEAWVAEAWRLVAGNFTDVHTVPTSKQKLANGFVLYIAAGSAGDARGGDHYLMLLAAYRPDTKRMYPSLFDASTNALYAELSPKAGNAMTTATVAAAPNASKPAPKQDAPKQDPQNGKLPVPDGTYPCFSLAYNGVTMMPYYVPSVLGQVVIHGSTYESPSYKGGGALRAAGTRIEFTSGPFAGWLAATGSDSGGPFIRFGKDPKVPSDRTMYGDHVCHRKQ